MFFDACVWNTVSAIKVAYLAKHDSVTVPCTKFSVSVLSALAECGAIGGFAVLCDDAKRRFAKITLAYINGVPAVSRILTVSRKSRRVYIKSTQLAKIYTSTRGCAVLSTSRGVLSGWKACQMKLGGELLVWVQY